MIENSQEQHLVLSALFLKKRKEKKDGNRNRCSVCHSFYHVCKKVKTKQNTQVKKKPHTSSTKESFTLQVHNVSLFADELMKSTMDIMYT